MDVKVTVDNDEDLFSNLCTMEDLGQMKAKRVVDTIEDNPKEFAKSLKEFNVIDDLQYKEMMIKIRKRDAESDFEDKDNE